MFHFVEFTFAYYTRRAFYTEWKLGSKRKRFLCATGTLDFHRHDSAEYIIWQALRRR